MAPLPSLEPMEVGKGPGWVCPSVPRGTSAKTTFWHNSFPCPVLNNQKPYLRLCFHRLAPCFAQAGYDVPDNQSPSGVSHVSLVQGGPALSSCGPQPSALLPVGKCLGASVEVHRLRLQVPTSLPATLGSPSMRGMGPQDRGEIPTPKGWSEI